jgi:hypothetical protein
LGLPKTYASGAPLLTRLGDPISSNVPIALGIIGFAAVTTGPLGPVLNRVEMRKAGMRVPTIAREDALFIKLDIP